MKIYTLASCEALIATYVNKYEGECITIEEGVLGLGTILLTNATGKKSVIIKETYLNSWSSGHTIRTYNKLPKKYELLTN
tara:strand:- start:1549 stop:1788 length:240 start_codon:yes stop_codon:yes gene_type:complete